VKVVVNGEPAEVPSGCTVAALVSVFTSGNTGVAVARNDDVVPRSAWADAVLAEDDRVEILTAVQGG
jgi:sulfur carrier protein